MKLSQINNKLNAHLNMPFGEYLDFTNENPENKGRLGMLFETQFFDKELDNKKMPDLHIFIDEYMDEFAMYMDKIVDVELKVAPFKKLKNEQLRAKERLILSKIDFHEEYEDFGSSELYSKIKIMLILNYLNTVNADLRDLALVNFKYINLDKEDTSVIENDYNIIVDKINKGEAHLLSGSDTKYLEACTKGKGKGEVTSQKNSSIAAKPRAFAFKASFVNELLLSHDKLDFINPHKEPNDFIFIEKRLNENKMKTICYLRNKYDISTSGKNSNSQLIASMLQLNSNSLDSISSFKKANIKVKTFYISNTGLPQNGINFNQIDWNEYDDTEWEDSALFETVNRQYLFVYFSNNKEPKFAGYKIQGFSDEEIEETRIKWEKGRELYTSGKNITNNLDKMKSNVTDLFYLRTKGQTKEKSYKEYNNGQKVKGLAWWVNSKWVKDNVVKPTCWLDLK